MIKALQYQARIEGVRAGGVQQALAFGTALSTGAYIFDIRHVEQLGAVQSQALQIGHDIAADSSPDRIGGRFAYNLNARTSSEQIEELAIAAGAAGLRQVWHVIISHRPSETIAPQQAEEIRQIFINVMGVRDCPQIWSSHRDKDHDHDHGLIVAWMAATGKPIKFGGAWWKETSQIALAICEHRLELQPEPNRRYVADSSGVYHLLTNTKIADAEGNLLLGAQGIRAMQREHHEIIERNDAPQGCNPGDPWPIERAAELLARTRISAAANWQHRHESLASVGFRFIMEGNAGFLEAATTASGYWGECKGERCPAEAAYPDAALGELFKRFGADYAPPAPGLKVRPFVMPRYNAPDELAAADKAARIDELSEYKALMEALETDYAATYKDKLVTEKGIGANAARAKRKAAHQEEIRAVKAARRHVVTPSKLAASNRLPPPPLPSNQVAALLWGDPRIGGAAVDVGRRPRSHLEDHYHVEPGKNETRYYLDGQIAIIERARTIELLVAARQARIHAVLLAQARFKKLRIVARHKLREALARIAAELDIELSPQRLNDAAEAHRAKVARNPDIGIVERARTWSRHKDRLAHLRSATHKDRRGLAQKAMSFNRATIGDWRRRNEAALNAPWQPNPPPNLNLEALLTLGRISRDQLQLVRSRYNVDGARFLDDPVLLSTFSGQERRIILPDVQARLEAIETLQIEQRRWIAAAVLNGRVGIQSGIMTANRTSDQWAETFWNAQKDDPKFHRLLAVSKLRPDRFAFNLDERPDVRAWRVVCARGDERLIGAMAEEIFAASVRHGDTVAKDARDRNTPAAPKAADVAWAYRHQLFEAMGYHDAEALRRTKGRFADTYRGYIYRRPGETDRAWDRRTRHHAKIYGPAREHFSR